MRRLISGLATAVALLAFSASPALAASGVEHLHFHAGPYVVTPGANLILVQANQVPKPSGDGFVVRFAPNLHYANANGSCCGPLPMVSDIHLHHGVWLSNGSASEGAGNSYFNLFYPFFAVGEEKTITSFPKGFGYEVNSGDAWILNYMIHNLTPVTRKVYITYDIDWIPMSSPAAQGMIPVHPIWMDVEAGSIYPVFTVAQHSGRNGKFTFPDMASDPYPGLAQPKNEFTIMHSGTLVGTAGHLHPGGLDNTLDLIRAGAHASGGAVPGGEPNSVRLFRSDAHYFDKRGPISWNMAMGATAADWRPRVDVGDTLRTSVTYDTKRASWYEVMGIMVVWEAYDDTNGTDPFTHKTDQTEHLTHGYLPENNDNGGSFSLGINPDKFPSCRGHVTAVNIKNFKYNPGDFTASGRQKCIPAVKTGHSLEFVNQDAQAEPANASAFDAVFGNQSWYSKSIFHSITSCQSPCGLNTGISYPLANGSGAFDSGQLGPWLPAVGTLTWNSPTNLRPGVYTFFCRIHPFMRGVFRVIG